MNGAELSAVAKLGSGSAERLGHRPCSGAGARPVTLAALKRGDADETVGCLWGQGRRRKVRSWGGMVCVLCSVWPGSRWRLFIGSTLSYFNRRRRLLLSTLLQPVRRWSTCRAAM